MKRIGFSLLLFSAFSTAAHSEESLSLLQRDCAHRGGTLISSWTCPSVDWVREGVFCEIKAADGTAMVFNGCDVDLFGYGDIFYSACVKHDLCYHHEPATSEKDKLQCDLGFYRDVKKICRNSESSRACEAMAEVYYQGVKTGGERSWGCSKVPADYRAVE